MSKGGSWGFAALQPRAGSPAEHLGWGARLYAVARYRRLWLFSIAGSWGFAALHPRAGSPAEHLGWGARLYAVARYRGLAWISVST